MILLPIKDPAHAKQRLSHCLSPSEREALQWAMVEDISRALAATTQADEIATVTSSRPVAEYFTQNGWTVISEGEQISESCSVDFSSKILMERGALAVLRLPADIPLVRPEDIDQLLRGAPTSPGALLVPSRDGRGTNALLRNPPNVFPSRFGPDSLEMHRREAARRGVTLKVCDNPRIALDLDTVEDLVYFKRLGTNTCTAQVVAGFWL